MNVNAMKTPQKKPNKRMSGKEMLNKAVYGTHIIKSPAQKRMEELQNYGKKK